MPWCVHSRLRWHRQCCTNASPTLTPGKLQTARGSRAAIPSSTWSGSADAERAGLGGRMILVALLAAAQVGAHTIEALCLLPTEANPSLALVHIYISGERCPKSSQAWHKRVYHRKKNNGKHSPSTNSETSCSFSTPTEVPSSSCSWERRSRDTFLSSGSRCSQKVSNRLASLILWAGESPG